MEQSQREQIKEAASRFLGDNLERVILSNPLHPEQMSKVKIRPVLLKEELCFQAEEQVGAQAFHRNLNRGEAAEYVTEKLEQAFRQCEMTSASETGLIRERMAALYTDAIRAQVLEYRGYGTQILEFIDREHTPKKILSRAVKGKGKGKNGEEIRRLLKFLQIEPTIVRLLAPELLEDGEQ